MPGLCGGFDWIDDLAEQVAPEREGGWRPRLRTAERGQMALRAVCRDDLLAADRLVWGFVERLDLSPLYRAIDAVEGLRGHPPADPWILAALWLHAAVEGVGSAPLRMPPGRARGTALGPHDGRTRLHRARPAPASRPAPAGPPPPATVREAVHHQALQQRGVADPEVRQRLVVHADPAAQPLAGCAASWRPTPEPPAGTRRRRARWRAGRVSKALAITEALHAEPEAGARRRAERAAGCGAPEREAAGEATKEKEPRASPPEAEARVMKLADGGFRPALTGC